MIGRWSKVIHQHALGEIHRPDLYSLEFYDLGNVQRHHVEAASFGIALTRQENI